MSIYYSGAFVKCLFRWRGSVWKAVWKELLIWLFCYSLLHLALAYSWQSYQNKIQSIVKVFEEYTKKLPVEFLLGFYVGQVVKRWWSQVKNIPWPDDALSMINVYFYKNDPKTQYQRCLAGRYITMSFVVALHTVSSHLKKKFPSYQRFVDCGLMTKEEETTLLNVHHENLRYDLPLQWVQLILRSKVGMHPDEIPPTALAPIVQELNKIRTSLRLLTTYNLIVLPLVYTQTVTVVVYGYFTFCFLGHQYSSVGNKDIFVILLTVLQFIFYVGWLKVAEVLHKPFGDDDDDINLSYWLERHTLAVYNMTEYAFDNPVDGVKLLTEFKEETIGDGIKTKDWSMSNITSLFKIVEQPKETSKLLGVKK